MASASSYRTSRISQYCQGKLSISPYILWCRTSDSYKNFPALDFQLSAVVQMLPEVFPVLIRCITVANSHSVAPVEPPVNQFRTPYGALPLDPTRGQSGLQPPGWFKGPLLFLQEEQSDQGLDCLPFLQMHCTPIHSIPIHVLHNTHEVTLELLFNWLSNQAIVLLADYYSEGDN